MNIALVTGSAGSIGSEAVDFLAAKFDLIVGIDNNTRRTLFGKEGSVEWNQKQIEATVSNYRHHQADIRHYESLSQIFREYGADIKLIVHAAAQPSHDWATRAPLTDFAINANGTLNMLEVTRLHAPEAVFIFTSTNKVYGDNPEYLPLVELDTRWEVHPEHRFYQAGINEMMSIDYTNHTLFGSSKVAADIVAQEYGRHFGLKVGVFRCSCLTGPRHSGVQLHGFLSYLMKCAITGKEYTIFGHKGKQVRDNIHSYDLVNMFWHFYQNPHQGEVYHAGGGRFADCSLLEAITLCEEITDKKMNYVYSPESRRSDVRWWVSDISKFRTHYPTWDYRYSLQDILLQIHEATLQRLEGKPEYAILA